MAQDEMFACEECMEEFVIAGSLYARPDWVLRCPCCGSTGVHVIDEPAFESAAHEAAQRVGYC